MFNGLVAFVHAVKACHNNAAALALKLAAGVSKVMDSSYVLAYSSRWRGRTAS